MSIHTASGISDDDALLTEVQTANLLKLSIRTLQAWRVRGAGPLFVRAGRAIRYRRSDIVAWIEANTVSATKSTIVAECAAR